MGNEAHKEPSMEEILASIRKIISDEESGQGAQADMENDEPAAVVEEAFDDFILDEVENSVAESLTELEETPASFGGAAEFEEDIYTGEVEETVAEAPPVAEPELTVEPEFVAAEPEPAVELPPMAHAESPAQESMEMSASHAYDRTTLTNDSTAETAAGALGKLISKMDLGGENTLEGMVRELLKPMLKEWLDDNLPRIVEEKVEAEVQRIAKMAR